MAVRVRLGLACFAMLVLTACGAAQPLAVPLSLVAQRHVVDLATADGTS